MVVTGIPEGHNPPQKKSLFIQRQLVPAVVIPLVCVAGLALMQETFDSGTQAPPTLEVTPQNPAAVKADDYQGTQGNADAQVNLGALITPTTAEQSGEQIGEARGSGSIAGGETSNKTTERQQEAGMLVFKELFLGMPLESACNVIARSTKFDCTISKQGTGDDVYTLYKIRAILEDDMINITEVFVNSESKKLIFGPVVFWVGAKTSRNSAETVIENNYKKNRYMSVVMQEVARNLTQDLRPFIIASEDGDGRILDLTGLCVITADRDNNVIDIKLEGSFTNAWFKVKDMSGEAFVKKFMDSYGIPEMQSTTFTQFGLSETTWEYASPNGFKLDITDSKQIHVTSIIKESELKFD